MKTVRQRGATAVMAGWVVVGMVGCCSISSTGRCLRTRTIQGAASNGETDQVRAWLADERSWVREEAALAAGQHGLRTVSSEVEARLLDPSEAPWVRTAAGTALAAMGTDVAADTLISVALVPQTPPSVKIALLRLICRVDPKSGGARVAALTKDPDVLVAAAAQREVQTQCSATK